MIEISRASTGYRPLYYGKKHLEGFVFYGDNGIIYEVNQAYIENRKEVKSASGKILERFEDVKMFELSQLRNARKIDFSKKDNFIIKGIVYIYCSPDSDAEYLRSFKIERDDWRVVNTYEYKVFRLNDFEITLKKLVKSTKNAKAIELERVVKAVYDAGFTSRDIESGVIERLYEKGLLKI